LHDNVITKVNSSSNVLLKLLDSLVWFCQLLVQHQPGSQTEYRP